MPASEPHRAGWNVLDFFTADVAVVASGFFQELGRKKPLAGQAFTLGYGDLAGQENATSRLFADFQLAANAGPANGDIRIDVHDPADRSVGTVFECRTEQLRATPTDRTVQMPFPELRDFQVGENWSFVLKMNPDAAGTIGIPETTLWMDVTAWTAT